MSTVSTRAVVVLATVGALTIAACSMAFVWRARESLRAAQSEIAGLKAQMAAPEGTTAGQQGRPGDANQPRNTQRPQRSRAADEALTNVLQRLDELAGLQLKTLALVQTLADKADEAGSPEQKLKQREATIAALEAALRDQQQQAAAATRTVDGLRLSLQAPEDVVALEPATGLALESLRQYWPYLEAKQKLRMAEQAVESLQRRLRQQRAEAAVDAREAAAPK